MASKEVLAQAGMVTLEGLGEADTAVEVEEEAVAGIDMEVMLPVMVAAVMEAEATDQGMAVAEVEVEAL